MYLKNEQKLKLQEFKCIKIHCDIFICKDLIESTDKNTKYQVISVFCAEYIGLLSFCLHNWFWNEYSNFIQLNL